MVIKRRFAIDFEAAKADALAWVLSSEKRKTLYKHREDATIRALFEKHYGAIEQEADDVVPDNIVVNDDDADKVRKRWFSRMQERMSAGDIGKSVVSLDPMTMWLIAEVIYYLIAWWLDNRRKRIRRQLGS